MSISSIFELLLDGLSSSSKSHGKPHGIRLSSGVAVETAKSAISQLSANGARVPLGQVVQLAPLGLGTHGLAGGGQ
jgi:hypothetical protein